MSALSAVEMALWDILGKTLNVPVYQLLGGKVNEKVRIYVNGWFAGAKTPQEFGEKAKIAVQRGVTAMKWDPFGKNYLEISNKDLDTALECVAAARDAVGKDVEWRKDVTNEALTYKDDYITIPDKPGLGIEINEEECLKHPCQTHTLRHYTGALTDIRPAKTEFYF